MASVNWNLVPRTERGKGGEALLEKRNDRLDLILEIRGEIESMKKTRKMDIYEIRSWRFDEVQGNKIEYNLSLARFIPRFISLYIYPGQEYLFLVNNAFRIKNNVS